MVQLVSSSYLSVAFSTAVFVACATNNDASVSDAFSTNLFDRVARVTKSNVNNIVNRFESPEKIMSQAVLDMQSDLVNVRQSYAEVTATQRRLIKKREQMDTNANEWYRRAQLAIQCGNDSLAKEALVRRQLALDEVTNMIQQINIQNSALERLYESMVLLEKKILESQSKKEQMIARAQTARAATKVNDMLSGLTGTTSMDAFKRMEEKVESLEAKAEISIDMIRIMNLPPSLSSTSTKSLLSSNSIEGQFQLLETQSSVDEELAKLKTKLLLEGTSRTGSTGSSSDGSTIPELSPSLSLSSSSLSASIGTAKPAATTKTTTTTTRVTTTTMEDPLYTKTQ